MRFDHILMSAALALLLAGPALAEPADPAVATEQSAAPDAGVTPAADAVSPGDGQTSAGTSEPQSAESSTGAEEVPEEVKKAAPPPPPARPTLSIDINLTTQTMSVAEDGVSKYTWRVSSGAYGYATPAGNFTPIWMTKMWYSRKYDNAPMPHAIFFSGGNAIHATYSVGMLGTPASHGCVRLSPSHASALYGLVSKHGRAATRIAVHGTPKYPPARIAKRQTYDPRYASYGIPPGYRNNYGYGYGTKYVYPGDAPTYYYAPKRRVQYGYKYAKPRRYVMRQYYGYSPYGY